MARMSRAKLAVPVLVAALGIVGVSAATATATATGGATQAPATVGTSASTTLSAAAVHPMGWVDTGAYFGSEITCADWGAKMVSEGYSDWYCEQRADGNWYLWLET
jgi:hypothetical protein